MSAYRLDVETTGGTTPFEIHATDRPAAEYEMEYVLGMFPLRHEDRTGRLYRTDGGRDELVAMITKKGEPW